MKKIKINIVELYPWLSNYGVVVKHSHPDLYMHKKQKLSDAFRKALRNDEEIDEEHVERLVDALPNWLKKHRILDNLSDSDREHLKQNVLSKDKFLNYYFGENQLKRSSVDQFRWMSIYTSLFCENEAIQEEWEAELKKATPPFQGASEYESYSNEQKEQYLDRLASLLHAIIVVYIENYA